MQLPPDYIMKEMAKMANEKAMTLLAAKARVFAKGLPDSVSGSDALNAFADAIEAVNRKRYGQGQTPS